MKKMSTLFMKNPNDLGLVINEINPENKWVFDVGGLPTQKFDGSSCAVINGELYKRYDAKHGKPAPEGGIPCQDPDPISGHWPHWVKCDRTNPADKWHYEAFDKWCTVEDGTYELCGPKIQKNPEKQHSHFLLKHGSVRLSLCTPLNFEYLKEYLRVNDIEGIVFHHEDGRMCKLRKSDFGFKR